jgi:hypothetical protein
VVFLRRHGFDASIRHCRGGEGCSMRKSLNRRTIGTGSALVLVAGLSVSALPQTSVSARPAAAQPTSVTVNLTQKVSSSTHKKLTFFISASHSAKGSSTPASSSAQFIVNAKGAHDSHTWAFPLSHNSVSYSVATGKGTINSGKQAKPYGTLKLSIKNKGKKKVSGCQAQKLVVQPVVLKGKWGFNTRSHGKNRWGKKFRSGKFRGRLSYFLGSGSCGSSSTCTRAVTWSASHLFGASFNQVFFSGQVAGANSTLTASRNVTLAKPKNSSRSDVVALTRHTKQKSSFKKGRATVTVGASGGVKGNATLSGPQGSNLSGQCGKGHTQVNTTWDSAYKNGSTPLTFKEQIEGPLKLPNISLSAPNDSALITRSTVK